MGPRRGLRLPRSRRSSGDWRTGVSPHHTIACGDVGGRVPDGACSSLAVEWPDPERAVAFRSQSGGCACVHETGWLWPLRIAKRIHEWATRGAERRNTAAYGHAISLVGAFRTVLGVGVDEAGSISWRLCTRRLVDLAARRLVGCRAVSSPAQWQRPRKWICARLFRFRELAGRGCSTSGPHH